MKKKKLLRIQNKSLDFFFLFITLCFRRKKQEVFLLLNTETVFVAEIVCPPQTRGGKQKQSFTKLIIVQYYYLVLFQFSTNNILLKNTGLWITQELTIQTCYNYEYQSWTKWDALEHLACGSQVGRTIYQGEIQQFSVESSI